MLAAAIETLSATSQHARAADAVGRAIAASPDDASLYRTRASLEEALGRDQAALDDHEQAYEKSDGADPEALIAALRRAIASSANDPSKDVQAARRHQRLRLSGVLAQTGDVDQARSELTDLVASFPRDRTALHALALLEESRGDWAAASAIYGKLVSLSDGEALVETALRLADACDRGDRLGDARAPLERARQIAPDNAGRVRQRLRDVYTVLGAGESSARFLLDDAARTEDPAARFTHLMQAGRLLIASEGEGGGPRRRCSSRRARSARTTRRPRSCSPTPTRSRGGSTRRA